MKKGFFFLQLVALGLSACSLIPDRSTESGYFNGNGEVSAHESVDDFYRDRAKQKWVSAQQELGLEKGVQELNENEVQAVRTRLTLKKLEDELSYNLEKKQYYHYKPYFRNDYERIHFLKLPNREVREQYARSRGLMALGSQHSPDTIRAIENSDVHKGMLPDAVLQSWGEPDFKEVAGEEVFGNQRWHYNTLVSSEEGYKQENRIIYFEGGRVVGWETL